MLQEPNSMDECLYYTRRTIGKGNAVAWVYRKECPQCHKAKMGKPVAKGKIKLRSTEYVCPACNFTEQKLEHEHSLTLEILYTCPSCQHKGETTIPYKRSTWNGVQAYVFTCEKCGEKQGLTKKMKDAKKGSVDDDD